MLVDKVKRADRDSRICQRFVISRVKRQFEAILIHLLSTSCKHMYVTTINNFKQ